MLVFIIVLSNIPLSVRPGHFVGGDEEGAGVDEGAGGVNCEGVRPPGVAPLPADKGCDHCQPGELRLPTLDNPDLPGGSSLTSHPVGINTERVKLNQHTNNNITTISY